MRIEKLQELGRVWIQHGKHRIYFNNLAELYGLETTHYNTGNVSSARVNGEKISNSKATALLLDLTHGKLYFDLTTQKFGFKDLPDSVAETLISKITELAN